MTRNCTDVGVRYEASEPLVIDCALLDYLLLRLCTYIIEGGLDIKRD